MPQYPLETHSLAYVSSGNARNLEKPSTLPDIPHKRQADDVERADDSITYYATNTRGTVLVRGTTLGRLRFAHVEPTCITSLERTSRTFEPQILGFRFDFVL